MKPDRILVHIAFALFMLLSQQMGIAHAISHLSPVKISDAEHDKHLPAEMQCARCLAFAAIGSALHGPLVLFAAPIRMQRISVVDTVALLLLPRRRVFNSRAPPVTG